MSNVEAVEKVPSLQLRYSDEKIDLSERAVFEDHAYGKDKSTPKYRALFQSGTFSTASLAIMNRFTSFLIFLVFPVAHGTPYAGEPGPPGQTENASTLRPYIHCDGFAGGVRGVILERRPQTARPWREVGFGGMSQPVSVVDGYRVTYSYPRTFRFANLRAERSHPSRYVDDKQIVTLSLVEMAKADRNTELVDFSDWGFSGQTLTKRELSGTTLGMTQIFSDEDSVIVTIYFMNQLPEHRRFQTHEEFISLRDDFIRGYIECVAKKKSAPIQRQR
jgi:hypothetical protein